jgi:hypothetical protein
MSDSTTPGCLCDYGNPTFSNGPCNQCRWEDVCKKGTVMNRELKAKLLEKIDFCLDIVQGGASQ